MFGFIYIREGNLNIVIETFTMSTLDELKEKVGKEASKNPEKFFAVKKLKEHGYKRYKCDSCGKFFWTVDKKREVCGEPSCDSGYTFIDSSPTDKKFSFVSAWNEFSDFMEKRGYTPIDRYPVAARWRDDTEFVRASIYDFQPYVVSGEVKPPANPLVVPQFCLRFNDIENVGFTGRHYTGFVMVGQHAFTSPNEYEQEKYFEDMLEWVLEGMGIPKKKLVLHEDSWGGGGNLGACMEFFVDGLELFNQVYMFYQIDNSEKGYSELDTKVLDMGMGLERIVWITHGSETSYEANMEKVVKKLYERTGVNPDKEIWKKFLPYSSLLNLDEVQDIEKTWEHIAEKIGVEKKELKKEINPAAALYSIADHSRSLLFALSDKILPSNSGEQHSLRVIARRSFDFIDKYSWDLDIKEVMEWHAEEMKEIFPELEKNIEHVKEIMEEEERKYGKMKDKAKKLVEKMDDVVDEDKMLALYESEGISPEMLERMGIKVDIGKDFYSKVSEKHKETSKDGDEEKGKIDLEGVNDTSIRYLEDEKKLEFTSEVLRIVEKDGKSYVVLKETYFYPTGGGQLHDTGSIENNVVKRVFKQGKVVLHELEEKPSFKEGEKVFCKIEEDRRKLLMQHHSATHLINAAARELLGEHVMQAGAKKTDEKARLDITHYKNISDEELDMIEKRVNQWINENLKVEKQVMEKSEAEKKYGFSVYQGGVPPGSSLRLVKIGDEMDVEACGGTHVSNTSEIKKVVLVGSTKVQDGVIRLEYKAGTAAEEYKKHREGLFRELNQWIDADDYSLKQISEIFDVPVDELSGVVERFVDEWFERKKEIEELKELVGVEGYNYDKRPENPEKLFEQWKKQKKDIKSLEKLFESKLKEELKENGSKIVFKEVPIDDVGVLIRISQDVVREEKNMSVVLKGEKAVIGCKGEDSDEEVREKVEEFAEVIQVHGNLVKGFKLK